MNTRIRVQFLGFDCEVQLGQYPNGRPALTLVNAIDGESVTTATVNLPNEQVAANEVFVKDWSETQACLTRCNWPVFSATRER
jgi:hypothetical protein